MRWFRGTSMLEGLLCPAHLMPWRTLLGRLARMEGTLDNDEKCDKHPSQQQVATALLTVDKNRRDKKVVDKENDEVSRKHLPDIEDNLPVEFKAHAVGGLDVLPEQRSREHNYP